jgi:hypothetical protein
MIENKFKKFLFEAVEHGKILKFTTSLLTLECFGSKITITWRKDTPKSTIKWHNLHTPASTVCYCSGYTSNAVDVKIHSCSEPTTYQVSFENGLEYDVPMTVVESDKLTALLSEAFQKYQEHYINSVIDHWNTYSKPDEFDDLLEEPKHVE